MVTPQHTAAPQLFISSTVVEFRDLRAMLTDTLRTLGIRVQSSELEDFDVRGDRPAIEECFTNIRESDYYVLIIGKTRGSPLAGC